LQARKAVEKEQSEQEKRKEEQDKVDSNKKKRSVFDTVYLLQIDGSKSVHNTNLPIDSSNNLKVGRFIFRETYCCFKIKVTK
jgi:hypothetical protein